MSAALLQECHAYLRAYQKHCSPSHPVRTLLANIDAHLAKPSCEAILAELVAVEDLLEGNDGGDWFSAVARLKEYERRKTAAWAAAREYFQREGK